MHNRNEEKKQLYNFFSKMFLKGGGGCIDINEERNLLKSWLWQKMHGRHRGVNIIITLRFDTSVKKQKHEFCSLLENAN